MLVVAIAQGALLIIGFWFVGVRSPALWGTLGGVASIIPVIGALIAWVPIALGLLVMGSYGKALALSLWCIILVGPSDNVLRPIVVGARNKQHPIIIALAAIGGTIAFGPLGIVLGPLTVSLAAVLFKQIQNLSSASHVGKDPVPDDNSLQA
jgi:predicted PurR-regulated permease PerM